MKSKTNFLLIFICVITISMTSCSVFKKGKSSAHEDFDKFYDKFHSNPDFQMSRINFPIKGFMIDGSKKSDWSKSNWSLMKIRIYDVDKKKYKVTFKKSDKSFDQKFWLENSGFSSEYRFELIENKWYLVYAKDVNI